MLVGQDNQLFTETFSPINGTLASGAVTATQAMNAATHTTSMDIFDSLGAKHTLTLHYLQILQLLLVLKSNFFHL